MDNNTIKYVEAKQVMSDWGVSKAKAYSIIRSLNSELKKQNPHAIIIPGRVNKEWYANACKININN